MEQNRIRTKKKFRLEDIITYQSIQNKSFTPKSRSITPKHTKNALTASSSNFYNTNNTNSSSPKFYCSRNRGIMKQTIAQRIEQYKKDHKNKKLRKTIQQMRFETAQDQLCQLKEVPQINQNSKKIYQKVAAKRNLSPQVLVRFQQYQQNRSLSKIKLKIQTYCKERRKIPKPQQVVSPGKVGQLEKAAKLIDLFNINLQKYSTRPRTRQRTCI